MTVLFWCFLWGACSVVMFGVLSTFSINNIREGKNGATPTKILLASIFMPFILVCAVVALFGMGVFQTVRFVLTGHRFKPEKQNENNN